MNDFEAPMVCFICPIPTGSHDIWSPGSNRDDCKRLTDGTGSADTLQYCDNSRVQVICENFGEKDAYVKLTGIVTANAVEDFKIHLLSEVVSEMNASMKNLHDDLGVLNILHPKIKSKLDKTMANEEL
jgi:hypothetical protein